MMKLLELFSKIKKKVVKIKKQILFYLRKEEYGWASNFERNYQIVDSVLYDSNEHYYQSEKAKDEGIKYWITTAPSPFLAMMAGRSLRPKEMVKDWDNKKLIIMKKGLKIKFNNQELGDKLLATKDAELHENSPTDLFWGIKGQDWLGKLLMEVREELKNEKEKPE